MIIDSKNKSARLTYHQDPGHGWIEFPKSKLADIGLTLAAFSGYSYQDANSIYVEEDCDASVLLDTLKRQGWTVELESLHVNRSHPIRNKRRIGA